jgi:hypothetical protein
MHDLRRRLHVLAELGILHVLLGDTLADPVQAHAIFLPPWRDRLADGSLGPEYGATGPGAWAEAWNDWRASIFGGGLWDAAEEHRRPAPPVKPAFAYEPPEAFLVRIGHTLPQTEARAASMRYRDNLRTPAIAKRLGLARADVEELLRVFFQRWAAA